MDLKLIDTHCHIQLPQYDPDRDEVILRAQQEGVGMLCVGVDYATSQQAITLAHQYEGLWASVGLHPNDNLTEVYDQTVYDVLARDPKVVAIGEIGLDYYRTTDAEQKDFQYKRFLEQLDLVRSSGKPVIIHCRDAHADMVKVLREQKDIRGVIHSFTGTPDEARAYVELGFHIGINGISTFANQYDESIKLIPTDQLILETDAPFLSPVPKRGGRNEPSYIMYTAQHVAGLRDVTVPDLCTQSLINSKRLFGI